MGGKSSAAYVTEAEAAIHEAMNNRHTKFHDVNENSFPVHLNKITSLLHAFVLGRNGNVAQIYRNYGVRSALDLKRREIIAI